MNKCSRCTKGSVTIVYPATSTIDVTEKAMKSLKISTKNAFKKDIQTCNACTSPKSRIELHKKNIFKRYEHQLLNLIVGYISNPNRNNRFSFDLNAVNRDGTRYDLIVKKSNVVSQVAKSPVVLVEIDESQHFAKKHFTEDRKREQDFLKKYSEKYTPYIIRIRLDEKKKNPCFIKKDGFCSFKDTKLFDKNIKRIEKYIENCFNNTRAIKHAYLNFSEDKEIVEFPSFDSLKKQVKKTKKPTSKIG